MRVEPSINVTPMSMYEAGNRAMDYAISHTDYHAINSEQYITEADREEKTMNYIPKSKMMLFFERHFKH